jgi:hypothetical protein
MGQKLQKLNYGDFAGEDKDYSTGLITHEDVK